MKENTYEITTLEKIEIKEKKPREKVPFTEVLKSIEKELSYIPLDDIIQLPGYGGPGRTFGQSSGVVCIPMQHKASAVAAVVGYETIKIWNIDTGECLKTFNGHTEDVRSLIQLADGRLVSGSDDSTIKIWNVETGECLKTLNGHASDIYPLVQLADGKLASGSYDKTIKIWNVETGECLKTLNEHAGHILSLVQLADGRLVSGSEDSTIKIWNVETGACLKTLKDSRPAVFLMQLADGRLASSANYSYSGRTIKIWNADTGECLKTLNDSEGVSFLMQLADGRLASGSIDTTIKFWCVDTGQCLKTLNGHNTDVEFLMQLADGRLVSYANEKTIRIWDTETGKCLQILKRDTYGSRPTLLANGKLVARDETQLLIIDLEPRSLITLEFNYLLDELIKVIGAKNSPKLSQDNSRGTILHSLIRLYGKTKRQEEVKQLIKRCLTLEVDLFAVDEDGNTAYELAKQLGYKGVAKILLRNRPEFNIAQVVLDWCIEDQGWSDVQSISGGKVEMMLVEEKITDKKKSAPKTQILSVQTISTEKRQVSQERKTTTDTEQRITLKLDNVLSDSNRTLQAKTKSQEQAKKSTSSQSNTNQSSSSQQTHHETQTVESSQWGFSLNSSFSMSTSASFFGLFGADTSFNLSTGFSKGGSEQNLNKQVEQTQNTNSKTNSFSNSQETMQSSSESSKQEQEKQKRFSFAEGKEQYNTRHFKKEDTSIVAFEKGYYFITSDQETTWTERKEFIMYFSVKGEVKIKLASGEKLLVEPIVKILKAREKVLRQVYPDYEWDFSHKNSVGFCLSGTASEHNSVIERANQEHPLYRIKRLIEEIVKTQNLNRKEKDWLTPAWLVNIEIFDNKINPYEGKIKVRCNADTDTVFLKKALQQFMNYSEEEQIEEIHLEDGSTLFVLDFAEAKDFAVIPLKDELKPIDNHLIISSQNESKNTKKPSAGLVRVNSMEFQSCFFNQVKHAKQHISASLIICKLVNVVCFPELFQEENNEKQLTPNVLVISEQSVLKIRFRTANLSKEDKIKINCIRLSLAALLEHAPDKLPAPRFIGINQWAEFNLDFSEIKLEKINFINNKDNHGMLLMLFKKNYASYLKKFSKCENILEKRDELYEGIKNKLKQSTETKSLENLDF